jgi:PAS domain S-box-containing protein
MTGRSKAGSTKPRRRKAPAAKRRRSPETIRGVTSSASKEELGSALLKRKLSEVRWLQRRAEEALRESEHKLHQIIDAVPSFLWSADPTGEPTYVNRRALDYSGLRFEEFKHGGWEAFIHPDDFPGTMKAFGQAIETGTSYETVHRLRRWDGEYRWHQARGDPLRDRDGRIIQWYGLAVDVDDARKAEDRLRRSEAWLAQAQRLSHTGTWVLDGITKRFLYWSDESYHIWGFDPLQGLPSRDDMWERIHPDDREAVWEEVQNAIREQREVFQEFRISLPDGTVKYLESNTYHEFSPLGELIEVICTAVDVTERKRAQDERERLRQLEADLAHINRLSMMGELAASLSHEILHPIATARNNARAGMRFLEMSPPNLTEVREALGCVVRDADRAKDIVGRIRSQIKRAPPRKMRFGLNEAVNEVIVMVRSAIAKDAISVSTRLMDGLAPVQGDRVQLQQVLVNLILNAVEAMSSIEDGTRELSIRTEQSQTGGILVAVHDSGPGVDPANLDRVFEPFYTTKASGIGMGLSICQTIINGHGGRLSMRANEPRGAVFQFTLPAAQEDL